MLVEFSVENFRSIKDEARLSLMAGRGAERLQTHLVAPETRKRGGDPVYLLRSAAIYGANAAGKTNLLRALSTMRDIVVDSKRDPGSIPVTPFAFDPACEDKPSTFEAICFVDGVRYQYGFSATPDRVADEWLYASPLGRVQHWLQRSGNTWKLGGKLAGDREVWRRATRPDALFLTTAVSLNSGQLRPLFDWFEKKLRVAIGGTWAENFSISVLKNQNDKSGMIDFLHAADLGISDLRLSEHEFRPDMLPKNMPVDTRERIIKDLAGKKIPQLWVSHDTGRGEPSELNMSEESDGTQKVFALAGPWLDSLQNGYVVVFDELHDNLHPTLVRFLVERFHDPNINRRGAQLIFSTHDTSILSQDVFRRDQIWFCERNSSHETKLFPLTDFHPRKGVENLEKAYLAGRYGALPYVDASPIITGQSRMRHAKAATTS